MLQIAPNGDGEDRLPPWQCYMGCLRGVMAWVEVPVVRGTPPSCGFEDGVRMRSVTRRRGACGGISAVPGHNSAVPRYTGAHCPLRASSSGTGAQFGRFVLVRGLKLAERDVCRVNAVSAVSNLPTRWTP